MTKVSIIIPLYKPEKEILEKIRDMIKKQTIKNIEVIENWNMPEAKSMNTGIKKAKGDIIVTLSQDCVPENKFWLEKLIKPLKNKEVSATVSDLYLTEKYWKRYPFLTRILTTNERVVKYPGMDARACAYRKETLKKTKLFNENPNVIAIESDLYFSLKKLGRIVHPGCKVYHLHYLDDKKKIKLDYEYAFSNGQIIRNLGLKDHIFLRRIIRGIPFLGLFSLFYRFPYKKIPHLFPLYVLLAPVQHLIYFFGFWKGFFFSNKESSRNTEVLNKTNQV